MVRVVGRPRPERFKESKRTQLWSGASYTFEELTDPQVSLTMINDLSHPSPPLLEKDV